MGYITAVENKTFGHFSEKERQKQYAKAVCKRQVGSTLPQLTESLKWKFGKCLLTKTVLQKIIEKEKPRLW